LHVCVANLWNTIGYDKSNRTWRKDRNVRKDEERKEENKNTRNPENQKKQKNKTMIPGPSCRSILEYIDRAKGIPFLFLYGRAPQIRKLSTYRKRINHVTSTAQHV